MSAVNKATTNLKLTFFNNCFNDEHSKHKLCQQDLDHNGTEGSILISKMSWLVRCPD